MEGKLRAYHLWEEWFNDAKGVDELQLKWVLLDHEGKTLYLADTEDEIQQYCDQHGYEVTFIKRLHEFQ